MHRTKPKVFLIGQSEINDLEFSNYLKHINATEFNIPRISDCEKLTEYMGRLCYRSWLPGLNKNVTKTRTDSAEYIRNILSSKHGSVLEHAVTHWIFADVSRVFTHELVRHRAGCAFSQESLRYVRLTDLGLWLPEQAEKDPELVKLFEQTFQNLEDIQSKLADYLKLDSPDNQFKEKKVFTSLMRRVAPIGLSTTIGVTFNFRALRHVIEMRTSVGAEAEIRVVFDTVAQLAKEKWPTIFQDFNKNEDGEWVPIFSKV